MKTYPVIWGLLINHEIKDPNQTNRIPWINSHSFRPRNLTNWYEKWPYSEGVHFFQSKHDFGASMLVFGDVAISEITTVDDLPGNETSWSQCGQMLYKILVARAAFIQLRLIELFWKDLFSDPNTEICSWLLCYQRVFFCVYSLALIFL